jgi:hypothetical protein
MASNWTKLFNKRFEESVLKVQEISRTNLCAIHIGAGNERYFFTSRLPDNGKAECIGTDDDGRIFAGASLFKIFIAIGVSLMIDKLSDDPDPQNKFQKLQSGWANTFTDVFNDFSPDLKIARLYGNPTVLDLVCHFKGPCEINHLFLAPNGSPFLSKNAFISMVSQYTKDTNTQDHLPGLKYSNANYILLGLLIEVVSGKSLTEFLKEYIFDPLGMHQTFMSTEQLHTVPIEQQVRPHIVSSDGRQRALGVDEITYLADTVEIAAMGGYTSAADIGKFFGALSDALRGQPGNNVFDKDFAVTLFVGVGKFVKGEGGEDLGYTRFGLYTTLDKDLPGSQSLNRLVSTNSDSSTYTLGKLPGNETVAAFYMAGCATGWLNTVYFLPNYRLYIIVLTNTSSPLDMSDIVSRLCLQEYFGLQPAKTNNPKFKCRPEGWKKMNMIEIHRAHYVELAARMFRENALAFRRLEEGDALLDTSTAAYTHALGIYENKTSGQFLELIDLIGVLGIRLGWRGEPKFSKPMRFVRRGSIFRICSYPRGSGVLAVDCFGDWRNLEFDIEEENRLINSLSRRGLNLVDRFTRT